jgi:hypothetical protein
MTSDRTRHTARAASDGGWMVSWLPGHTPPQSQVTAAKRGGQAASRQGEPVSATVAAAGPELSVEARVEALDGSERKLILDQLVRGYPDVVEAGFALVAQWRAECAEKRRTGLRRREHDRRRRRAGGLDRELHSCRSFGT